MTFEELQGESLVEPVVALFYGLQCPPCARLKPKLREVCERLGVRLEEFNSGAEMDAVRALGIRTVPTVVLVARNGTSVLFSGDVADIEARLRQAGAVTAW